MGNYEFILGLLLLVVSFAGFVLARNFLLIKEDEILVIRRFSPKGQVDHLKKADDRMFQWKSYPQYLGFFSLQFGLVDMISRLLGLYHVERIPIEQIRENFKVTGIQCQQDPNTKSIPSMTFPEISCTYMLEFFGPDGTFHERQAGAQFADYSLKKKTYHEAIEDVIKEVLNSQTQNLPPEAVRRLVNQSLTAEMNKALAKKNDPLCIKVQELIISQPPFFNDAEQEKQYQLEITERIRMSTDEIKRQNQLKEADNQKQISEKEAEARKNAMELLAEALGLNNLSPKERAELLLEYQRNESLGKLGNNADMVLGGGGILGSLLGGGKGKRQ